MNGPVPDRQYSVRCPAYTSFAEARTVEAKDAETAAILWAEALDSGVGGLGYARGLTVEVTCPDGRTALFRMVGVVVCDYRATPQG